MDIFSTQYSVLSAKALNLKIQESYGFKEMHCRLLIHNVSDTYVIESPAAKYIFKIYRDAHRKLDEIQGEVELLNMLSASGAKVSYPIRDVNGNQIQAFNAAEGIRYGVLFSWAEGEVVYSLTNQQLEMVGREMATIHNITSAIKLQHQRKAYTISTTITEPLANVKPAFSELTDEYTYLKTTGEMVTAKLAGLDLTAFSIGYCHFDFFPKNFHFTNDGSLTFFDFDFAGKGLLAYDITSFYIHYFLQVTFNKISQAEADRDFRVFIQSYRQVRPLSNQELEAIPYLGFAFWMFYMGFHYENFDDWSNFFFSPKFIKERVGLIKQWMEHPFNLTR